MMINRDRFKKSNFKNIEKDLAFIVSKIMENEQLLKLLSLKETQSNSLNEKEKKEILEQCIKIVPKIEDIDNEKPWSYLIIVFDDMTPNEENPEYRDKILYFDVICHFDTWNMGDFKLRPYQIVGELDKLFNKKPLVDSYTLNFMGTEFLGVNEKIAGLIHTYAVTYSTNGDEDDD